MWRRALSTMPSGVAPLYFLRMSFSSDPAFTPMRMGMPRSRAQSATARTFRAPPIFPGLIRRPSAPARAAAMARRWSKWMSARTGMRTCALMRERASAASASGTATRTMSQPAASRRRIWATVAATSGVGVLVMDWTVTGAPPPTATPPTVIARVALRRIGFMRLVASRFTRPDRVPGLPAPGRPVVFAPGVAKRTPPVVGSVHQHSIGCPNEGPVRFTRTRHPTRTAHRIPESQAERRPDRCRIVAHRPSFHESEGRIFGFHNRHVGAHQAGSLT